MSEFRVVQNTSLVISLLKRIMRKQSAQILLPKPSLTQFLCLQLLANLLSELFRWLQNLLAWFHNYIVMVIWSLCLPHKMGRHIVFSSVVCPSVRLSVRLSGHTDGHLLCTKIPNKCPSVRTFHSLSPAYEIGRGILKWRCPSVRPSVRPSVLPSVRPSPAFSQ